MVPKINFRVIDLGVFDPEYLGIQDFDKDWSIYSKTVIIHNLGSKTLRKCIEKKVKSKQCPRAKIV